MQQCPWCKEYLGESQLFSLDDRLPSECNYCGGFIRNSRVRDLAAFLISLIAFIVVLVLQAHPAFWLVPLVLYPFSKILLAKPLKVQYEEKLCLDCQHSDVGYRGMFDDVCDDCMTKREQAAKETHVT